MQSIITFVKTGQVLCSNEFSGERK